MGRKNSFIRIVLSVIVLSISHIANATTPCLAKLTTEVKITKAELDLCVVAVVEDIQNVHTSFEEIISELAKEKYVPIQRYFMSSDLIRTLKPTDTISIYQRYAAMKDVLKQLVRKDLIKEEQIIEGLDQMVLPCTFKAVTDFYDKPSYRLLDKIEEHLINKIHTEQEFHHSLRVNYAKLICRADNNRLSDEIADYFSDLYPNQLSRILKSITNNGRIEIEITPHSKNKIINALFQQIEKENIKQSYYTIQTIEYLTNLKFINKYLRYPDRDMHYKAVRKKALKYYEDTFLPEYILSTKHPIKPSQTRLELHLKHEVDSLEKNRRLQLDKFQSNLSSSCSIAEEEKVFVQLSIDPSGELLAYTILRKDNLKEKVIDCIDDILQNKPPSFGEVKIIPSARAGSKPSKVLYSILIKP